MNKKLMLFTSAFIFAGIPVFGATDGDDQKKKLEILEGLSGKLGVSSTDLAALVKGEKKLDDVVGAVVTKTEAAIEARIKTEVEKKSKAEIMSGIYAKVEKQLVEASGGLLKAEDYADDDKKNRFNKMVVDLKKKQGDKLKELEDKYKGADAEKVKEMQATIDKANETIDKLKADHETALADKDKVFTSYKNNQVIGAKKASLIEGTENKRLDAKDIRDLLDMELQRAGYGYEIEESNGDKGKVTRVFLTDNEGKRVKNSQKPTENLTLESFYGQVSESRQFAKKSNGGEDEKHKFTDKDLENKGKNTHPGFNQWVNEQLGE